MPTRRIKFTHPNYPDQHYNEVWELTDLFCPQCGAKEVWREQGSGDYYQGPSHLCLTGDHYFTLPTLDTVTGGSDAMRLAQLKTAEDQA